MTERQSALDFSSHSTSSMLGQVNLRTGQVACPYAPIGADHDKFDEYVTRCLATWSVDVVLDDGQYLSMCRIIAPQGNLREGFRRMLEFPKNDFSNKYWLGDKVVVGFLNGTAARPVILGCLFPVPLDADPTKTLTDLAATQYVVTDHHEWGDRHEVVDYTRTTNPVTASTDARDSASDRSIEHIVVRSNNDTVADNMEARVTKTDLGALVLVKEHSVESGVASARTTNLVHVEDDNATDLSTVHTVEELSGPDTLSHSLTTQDLAVKILQLEQLVEVQAGVLTQLLLKSTNATQLEALHTGRNQTVLVSSDDTVEVFSVTKTSTPTGAEAALSMGVDGLTILRRKSSGQPDAVVQFNTNGDIVVQSAQGSKVTLSSGNITAKTVLATVSMDDSLGISLLDGFGDSVHVKNGVVSVAAPSVVITATAIGLSSAAITAGSSNAHSVPAADVLYPKLAHLEERVVRLETGMTLHTHLANKTPSIDSLVVPELATSFIEPSKDALKSFKGD